jgi:cytidine deaminase
LIFALHDFHLSINIMEQRQFITHYMSYDHMDQLSNVDRDLMLMAVDQLEVAYAPYSGFRVGAAVLTTDNRLFVGCNQENASYPLCSCAERVALNHAGAVAPSSPIQAIAITAKSPSLPLTSPVSPCGACRQIISEYEHRHSRDIRILLKGESDTIYVFASIKALLPFGFDGTVL